MSLSSLSAQLASLHSKKGAPSRQHSDAVGRGIHHSSKLGHTVLNKSTKHKPSVLYPDSRAAASADVPLTTLRENAIASLRYLCNNSSQVFDFGGENLPWKTLFGPKSIKFEHGLNTKETNAKFDRMIKDALYLISSAWSDSVNPLSGPNNSYIQLGANKPSSVLHTLEYLIQKYYVHVYNAEVLLVAFLPHHETFLFDRLLQLIDIAQFPQWSFLRPYSAARGINGVPRTAIAKWAASVKDNGGGTAIVEWICEIAKRAAQIHARERKSGYQSQQARKGISSCISFAAATLAETIHIQKNTTGSVDESFLRVMIPVVLSSIEPLHQKSSSKKSIHFSIGALCSEWRSFGRIMISLIVESCELSGDLNYALIHAVVKGCRETVLLCIHDDMAARGEDFSQQKIDMDYFDSAPSSASLQESILEVTSDAILTVMTILHRSHHQQGKITNQRSLLKVIPSSSNDKQEVQYVGYDIPSNVILAVTKIPYLPSTLGYVLVDKNIDIRVLIASIFAYAISQSSLKRNSGYNKLLFKLTTEGSISSALKDEKYNLVASITSCLIQSVSNVDSIPSDETMDSFAKLLEAMKFISSSGTDVGITRSLSSVASLSSNTKQLQIIQSLLTQSGHLHESIIAKDLGEDEAGAKNDDIPEFGEDTIANMLPPLMALEHPSSPVRIQAISKLQKSLLSSEHDMDDVANSLFRRYVSDDDLTVATKAIDAILWLNSNNLIPEKMYTKADVKEDITLQIEKLRSQLPQATECLNSSLSLTALVIQVNIQHMSCLNSETEFRLIQSLLSHALDTESGNDSKRLSQTALSSLLHALGEDTELANCKNDALVTICKSNVFLNVMNKCASHESLDIETKRTLSLLYLKAWFVTGRANEQSRQLKSHIVNVGVFLITCPDEDVANDDVSLRNSYEMIQQLLENSLEFECAEDSIQVIIKLAQSSSSSTYDNLSVNLIKSIIDKRKEDSSMSSILMLFEALLSPTIKSSGVERLLELFALYASPTKNTNENGITLVSILSLCGHAELRVRKRAMQLLQDVGEKLPKKEVYSKAIRSFCTSKCNTKTSILMDGVNALPHLLRAITNNESESEVTDFLLKSCYLMGKKGLESSEHPHSGEGLCSAVSILLSAMESSGEKTFSLSQRWQTAGQPLFHVFTTVGKSSPVALTPTQRNLLECIVIMLKGVTISNDSVSQGIIISNEVTASGRRSRSYSVGTSEGICIIKNYPANMTTSIVDFLGYMAENKINKCISEIFETINSLVIRRSSWVNGVFTKSEKTVRKAIASHLLHICCHHHIKSAGLAMVDLQLSVSEILELNDSDELLQSETDPAGLYGMIVITDCIRHQSKDFVTDGNINMLVSSLFQKLHKLSSRRSATPSYGDHNDYTRCCIVYSLLPLTENVESMHIPSIEKYANLLVALVGDDDPSNDIKPFSSSRIKSLSLQLLTNLCAISPADIVGTLVPAMINSMALSSKSSHVKTSENTLMAIIPAYCDHASSAGLSIMDLLKAFIECKLWQEDFSWGQKYQLYSNVVKSLSSHVECKGGVIATTITAFIASETAKNIKMKKEEIGSPGPKSFVAKLLDEVEISDQIDFSLHVIDYIKKMLPFLTSDRTEIEESEKMTNFFLVSPTSIKSLMVLSETSKAGPDEENVAMMWLIITMIEVLENVYLSPALKRFIRVCDDKKASVCLKVWQELVNLQALMSHNHTHQNTEFSTAKFWRVVTNSTGNILATVQRILPTPHFLASVTLLIDDPSNTVDLKRRALLLLSERSAEVDANTHEATLFLEMVPNLVKIAKFKNTMNASADGFHLRQISFEAIDNLAKNLGLGVTEEKLRRKRAGLFLPAFNTVAVFLRYESGNNTRWLSERNLDTNEGTDSIAAQVISSAAFCAATLVTLLNVKCVPYLQGLVKPSISLLKAINACLFGKNNEAEGPRRQSFQLITLAILRTLVAVAENIPQFLTPFMEVLLSPDCLPIIKVSQDTNEEGLAIQSMTERLEAAIATKSPIHQLVPTLQKAIKKSSQHGGGEFDWKVCLSILRILKVSISQSSRNELSPLVGKVLNALVQIYGYESEEGRIILLKEANETLLSLVMKLSESQLQSLYSRLREWRGGFDPSSQSKTLTCRRFAFWSLSAAISEKLRNIFLPCMSIIVVDLIKELNHAATCLSSNSLKAQGSKRQKTQDISYNIEYLSPLQPLLLCLEYALKADAHEGGNWVRSEDGQRYRSILEPLGKLLRASVPSNIYVSSDENDAKQFSAYEKLIEGNSTDEHGNVSQTLTALAAAAGNEQLWKPLNFLLLEACGDERRSEVRKTGVKSLLSIIQTLGEEYMVLLPECLPVLSELLEDDDESIVALAKECVHHGEELLGESLEDSLR